MKNNKGITLIALIITIVVLLILAVVAISAVSDNGIIGKAQKAKDSYGDAANKENQTIGEYASEIDKYAGTGTDEPIVDINNVDIEALKQNIENNYQNYLKKSGQTTSTDIGIGTDGKVVNLDWWIYQKNGGNKEVELSAGCGMSSYQGKIVDGKIQGTVPQYIYSKEGQKGELYTVTNMYYAFCGQSNLETAPEIPYNVTDASYMFFRCGSLKTAPEIPSSVTSADNMFAYCTNLETAPEIPSSVISAYNMFCGCVKLETPPTLQNGIVNISGMFLGCTSLTSAPTIPQSVTRAACTFSGCENLGGVIKILSKNIEVIYEGSLASGFMYGVGSAEKPITLEGSGDNIETLEKIKETAGPGYKEYVTIN